MTNPSNQPTGRASLTKIKGLILAALIFGAMALPSSVFAQNESNAVAAITIAIHLVNDLPSGLDEPEKEKLVKKLENILASVTDGNFDAACGKLHSFFGVLDGLVAANKLDPLYAFGFLDRPFIEEALGCK